MKNIDSDLIRGNIDTIILKTMLEEDKYGLDIIKEVEQRSNGTYELKQPTLYSCLKRLENQELISSYWKNSDIGGKRHYYKLTDKGREFYNNKQEEWAKSKFVIDNLLSNYNYEEYRLVKKDDYDKAMSNAQNNQSSDDELQNIMPDDNQDEDVENETLESDDFDGLDIEDDAENQATQDDDFDELESNDFEKNQTDDFPTLESDDDFDFESDEDENYQLEQDEDEVESDAFEHSYSEDDFDEQAEDLDESDVDEDDMVYVSNSYNLNEEYSDDDDEDEIIDSNASYDIEDQTQNETNILNMLRKQDNEEINTYEGDKKSYANQIRSIYDDVKYVQDDMIVAEDDENDDEIDKAINDFTAAAQELNNFGANAQDDEIENDNEDAEFDDDELDIQENDEISELLNEEYDEDDLIESEEIENLSFDYIAEDDNQDDFDNEFENEHKFDENKNYASFFESTDADDYEGVMFEEETPQEPENLYENEETCDYQNENDNQNDFSWNDAEEDLQDQTVCYPDQNENDGKFDKEAYESTFINIKKTSSAQSNDELTAENLDNSDIDSIISKNAPNLNTKPDDYFDRRYMAENYKQKLSNLSAYSKATETQQKNRLSGEVAEADDMETLKLNFEREGIKVKEFKKSNSFEQPEKTYLLANKINLIKSVILLLGYVFVLSAMYIILENSSFGIMTEGFHIKYFLFGMIPFALIALYHLVVFIINPYKKVPARYASRIMIFISVIITVQLLLITYCVNLQLGFYSFVQAGYNHLLWLIPSIISFGPVISTLTYMALFYTNNFNV